MDIAVSVVVPTHNGSRGLLRGLESLRRQSLRRERFEVLYVDDGSTDGTAELLDAETAGDPNVEVVRIDGSGWPGRPRNVGVRKARGRYVLFMDDDDRLGPEALQRLYRRAERDRADIVVGRMAGVGRNAPREIFQRPMSGGSLRSRAQLLSTLTVHKLFRREFLLDNGLAFPEGRVRLEDHMFMLRAYLATERVSVLHDHTCYFWVRDGKSNNISYARKEPGEFLGSIERIFDIIDEQVEPGPFRDRLIAHWLRSKLLGLFQGRSFLRQDDDRVALMHRLAGDLVRRRVTASAAARLNPFARLRLAALTGGGPDALRRVAEFEEDVAHRTRITGFRWRGSELAVDVETGLERVSSGAPLEFVREGGSVYWDLPADLAAVPEIKRAAEIGDAPPAAAWRAYASRPDDPAVVRLPLDYKVCEEPAEAPGRFRLRLSGSLRIDAETADHGRPLAGTWRFDTRVVLGGVSSGHTLGPERASGAERTRVPAFVGPRDRARFANPYWNSDGVLVFSTTGSRRPLRRALRTGRPVGVARTAAGLRLDIPLAVQAAIPGELTLTLAREGREPISAPARVTAQPCPAGHGSLPTAILSATLPVPSARGALHVGVGEGDEYTELGIDLYWTPAGWRIGRPAGGLARRCARAGTRGVRRLAGRLSEPLRRVPAFAGQEPPSEQGSEQGSEEPTGDGAAVPRSGRAIAPSALPRRGGAPSEEVPAGHGAKR
ncbi:glycosyltransferase family 2 protein [Streptomonospora wellingtoniae]|uniref:Glycosyltransferase n=1 Tax=Streptomonospora wellingtoniae TaxID=3075544 RepID=A0ABU2KQV5_9ACTN|nr:glycosyltransferase [Streptomonospora sp. DSM 45055]MDT0301638.1 glycosyltransferase [Streptomonospora sp. DSM 45055]